MSPPSVRFLRVAFALLLGRLGMAVHYAGRVHLFEFKVIEQSGAGSALAQLKERRYADKYRGGEAPVRLVGLEFSSADRNIRTFEAEAV